MRWHLFRFSRKFRLSREFRKQLRLLIIVTLGFTVAFTWRQTVFDLSLSIVKAFTSIESTSALSILASSFITLVSLGLIYATSHILKDKPDYY